MSTFKEKDLYSLSQVSVNYVFFVFYFVFISIIHVYHVFLIEPDATFSRYFFLVHSIIQSAIETILLVLFANAIKIFFHVKAMALYSMVAFFLMLTHVIDFPFVRFMDMSFWYTLSRISGESPQNFLELLYASNISLLIWLSLGIAGFVILLSAIYLYRISEKWSHRRACVIPYPMLAAMLCTLCLFLMSWDYSTHKWVARSHYDLYEKTLPWKSTFFRRHREFIALAHPLKELQPQETLLKSVDRNAMACAKKPDIFIFIVESLREDFIQERQAPHLYQFKKDFTHFDLALANANATQNSWFSLFYAQYPFYWDKLDPKVWKGGSVPLILLKEELGYKIHCYSATRLKFYQMDQRIFGDNAHLADQLYSFGEPSDPQYAKDKKAIEKMIEDMKSGPAGGRVFIIFLDSTHHDYSWPANQASLFEPFDEKINFIKAALSNSGLEMIKNRYRNALFYVDSLFGTFMDVFNTYEGSEEGVIVVTGDHGEEFYEEGHLFHASHLSRAQTHIPIYYKFGKSSSFATQEHASMTCHMDVFPTLFHYLTGKEIFQGLLEGQSVFSDTPRLFTVTTRYNASHSPCEFCIHNGKQKLTATFSDERDIFNAKGLRVISMKNDKDEIIPHDLNSLKEHFGGALDQIFAP